MIRVRILELDKLIEIYEDKITVRDLLRKLGLSESEHIVFKNNTVVTEEDTLQDGDDVVVFTVKSGG